MFQKLYKSKGFAKQNKFEWIKYNDEPNKEDSDEESNSSNSSFDPMESKLREFQFQKIQKELKRKDEQKENNNFENGSSE